VVGTPAQEQLQIGPGVDPGQALVAGQVRGDRHAEQIISSRLQYDNISQTTTVPPAGGRALGGKSVRARQCHVRRYALYRQCVERVCAEHGS